MPVVQKISFHLPHIRIIVTCHYGNTRLEAFKSRAAYQDVFWRQYYTEFVVTVFSHQTQSEYYISKSIFIYWMHWIISATHQGTLSSSFHSGKRHDVFQYFMSGNSKKDASKTSSHSKHKLFFLSEYHRGLYIWLCRALQMWYSIILIFYIVTGL